MNDVIKEIEEMSKLLETDDVPEPKPEPEPEIEPESGLEPKLDSEPQLDPESSPEPEPEPIESADEEPTDPPESETPSEIDELKTELAALREEMALRQKKETTPAPPTAAPPTDAPIVDQDFVGDIDLDELTRDKDALNKLLNTVHRGGIEQARTEVRTGSERILLSLPELTRKNLEVVMNLAEARKTFYEDNEDLEPFNKVVALVFEEEAAKNPGKEISELLKENVGPEVRSRLDLMKKATEKRKDDPPPKLPKKGSQPRTPKTEPKPDAMSSQIDDMNKALNT